MTEKALLGLTVFSLITFLLLVVHVCATEAPPGSATMGPIVSTEWLANNLGKKDLVVLDVRTEKEYKDGHIPNAVNKPFAVPVSDWIVMRNELLLELPEDSALVSVIGSCGINKDSRVVIVTAPQPPAPPYYGLANATRVADTLIYAGIANVAVLDGGYPKWSAEGKSSTKESSVVAPVAYKGAFDKTMFVSADYVRKQIGKATIIDARDANIYFGESTEPYAAKPGHIQSARSLPAPWIWKSMEKEPEKGIYVYKDKKVLEAMASGVLGKDKNKEIIVYCGVGGYASSWWFVMTRVLGYHHVKFYDGSAQEWVRNHKMVPYRWN